MASEHCLACTRPIDRLEPRRTYLCDPFYVILELHAVRAADLVVEHYNSLVSTVSTDVLLRMGRVHYPRTPIEPMPAYPCSSTCDFATLFWRKSLCFCLTLESARSSLAMMPFC